MLKVAQRVRRFELKSCQISEAGPGFWGRGSKIRERDGTCRPVRSPHRLVSRYMKFFMSQCQVFIIVQPHHQCNVRPQTWMLRSKSKENLEGQGCQHTDWRKGRLHTENLG